MSENFSGFPKGTFRFLRGLTEDNSKAWFEAHREEYDEFYIVPARAFVAALGPRLQPISPTVRFEPKVNGSIFRIQRDTRFSKDKRPYKNHLDLWFWHGEHRGWESPGFFFRMFADRLILGAGMHRFEGPLLDSYRKAVMDERAGNTLETAIAAVRRAGPYEIGGATPKTVPRGYEADYPRAGFLLHEGLYAELESSLPKEACTRGFVDYCAGRLDAMSPIVRWLLDLRQAHATAGGKP